jgi:hypothetical protein
MFPNLLKVVRTPAVSPSRRPGCPPKVLENAKQNGYGRNPGSKVDSEHGTKTGKTTQKA